MGFDQSSVDEIEGQDINPGSVSTDSIVDNQDGQALETLRDAGFETGDVLPVAHFSPADIGSFSTTSTTFIAASGGGIHHFTPDLVAPSNTQLVAALAGDFRVGNGETVDVRFRAGNTSETVVELTGITTNTETMTAWTEFNANAPGGTLDVRFEHRTNPGTNGDTVFGPEFYLGVQL